MWRIKAAQSRFFAALIGVNGSRLHFFDVQEALRTQARSLDVFAGIRIGLYLGHAQHFFVWVGHGVTKTGGFLLSRGTHGLFIVIGQCVAVLRLGKGPQGKA